MTSKASGNRKHSSPVPRGSLTPLEAQYIGQNITADPHGNRRQRREWARLNPGEEPPPRREAEEE